MKTCEIIIAIIGGIILLPAIIICTVALLRDWIEMVSEGFQDVIFKKKHD